METLYKDNYERFTCARLGSHLPSLTPKRLSLNLLEELRFLYSADKDERELKDLEVEREVSRWEPWTRRFWTENFWDLLERIEKGLEGEGFFL